MALELFDGPSMPDECIQNDGGFNLVEFYASPTGKHDKTQLYTPLCPTPTTEILCIYN